MDHIGVTSVCKNDYVPYIEYGPQALETAAKKCLAVEQPQNLFGAFLTAERP
jgi:hypothetical protein